MPPKPDIVPAEAVWMNHMNAWVDPQGNIYSGEADRLGQRISAQLFSPEDVRAAQSIFRSARTQQFQDVLGQDPRTQMLGQYGQQYLASAMPGASAMYATSQLMPGEIGGVGEGARTAETYEPGLATTVGGERYRAPSFAAWATGGGPTPATQPGYRRFTQQDYQTRMQDLSPFLVGGQETLAADATDAQTAYQAANPYARMGYQDATADAQRAMRQQWGVGLGEGAGAQAAREIDFADAKALIMGAAGLGGVSPANPGAYYAARDLSRRIDAFKVANPEAGGYQLLQDYTARGGSLGGGGGFAQFAQGSTA